MAGLKKTLIIKTKNNAGLNNNNRSILTKYSKEASWQLQFKFKTNKIKNRSLETIIKNFGKQSWLMAFLAPTNPANTYFV